MLFVKLLITVCYVSFSWSSPLFTQEACLPLDECPSLENLVKTRQFHLGTINLLQRLRCFDDGLGKTHLRCISAKKIDDFIKKTDLLPRFDDCGDDILQPKISNGEISELDEFPWIALLKYRDDKNNIKYACQGNLISKKYLVTAAHCVNPEELKRKQLSLNSVVLGEYDIKNETDCVYTQAGKECAEPIKEFSVESIQVHPNYNSLLKVSDIALVRLKGEVEFSEYIKPICLPLFYTHLGSNVTWWVGGWGENENHEMNSVKVKAKFSLKAKETCRSNVNLTDTHLCVASTGDSKTCPGDSGGPLMMKKRVALNIKVFLIGVNSLGISECSRNIKLSIFTKTSSFIDWIIFSLEE